MNGSAYRIKLLWRQLFCLDCQGPVSRNICLHCSQKHNNWVIQVEERLALCNYPGFPEVKFV